MMDWLADTWQAFIDWCYDILEIVFTFLKDLALNVFELIMDGVVYVYSLLQPPDFLTGGMQSLFSALHPDILYFLGQSGLSTGLAIYGAGVSFRLLRKLFTLGQW
ncbi:MAG: hypothetical protein GY774_36300 [Planctomycetes bacterium]|nr:hypothetical protein [Planctomycetota bacterium]